MGTTVAGLGRTLSVSGSQLNDYRDRGVTEKVGDRLATKAGFATYEVWPEMIDHAIEDEGDRQRQMASARQARYRAKRPHLAGLNRQYLRQYRADASVVAQRSEQKRRAARYARHAEEERAQRRAYYQANRDMILAQRREFYKVKKAVHSLEEPCAQVRTQGCTPSDPQAAHETMG